MFAGELHSACSSPAFGCCTAFTKGGEEGQELPDAPPRRTHRQNRAFLLISCRKMRPLPIDFPRKSWYNSKKYDRWLSACTHPVK